MEEKYIMNEGEFIPKEVEQPTAADYHDINESDAERERRIYLYNLYNEVK